MYVLPQLGWDTSSLTYMHLYTHACTHTHTTHNTHTQHTPPCTKCSSLPDPQPSHMPPTDRVSPRHVQSATRLMKTSQLPIDVPVPVPPLIPRPQRVRCHPMILMSWPEPASPGAQPYEAPVVDQLIPHCAGTPWDFNSLQPINS